MGFISLHESYYLNNLTRFEQESMSPEDLYLARQMLKLLDDLTDEGYTSLNEHLEEKYRVLTRLRAVIRREGAEPFPILHPDLPAPSYAEQILSLTDVLDQMREEGRLGAASANQFLPELRRFTDWLGFEEDTAYVFLLRDTLLPYLRFSADHAGWAYPWLIGRSFLNTLSGSDDFDDAVRASVFNALEQGKASFEAFSAFCGREIRQTLNDAPAVKNALQTLLSAVPGKRIVVVESGYCGTVPMLLSALDERVEVRMYTAAPYLYDTYGERLFCRKFERIRDFETLVAQDLSLCFDSFRDGRFRVRVNVDAAVRAEAASEIAGMLK